MDKINKLREIINSSKRIVFFSGAGVSTGSGIPDFRSNEGLYNQKTAVPSEIILSHNYFINYTKEFYDFYKSQMLYPDAKPNIAHKKPLNGKKKISSLPSSLKISIICTKKPAVEMWWNCMAAYIGTFA